MFNMRILSTGSYLPKNIVTNDDLSKIIDTSDEWIQKRVGIKSRHFAVNESTTDLAEQAALNALKKSNINVDDLDLIIGATSSPDFIFPGMAVELKTRLKCTGNIPAFDISAACSGFVYALDIAKQYIENGSAKKVLIVASERVSRVLDWNDRSTCVLFGDGAGAVIVESTSQTGFIASKIHSDGSIADILYLKSNLPSLYKDDFGKNKIQMVGNKVFKLAVSHLSNLVTELLTDAKLESKDIDCLVPHQANLRIMEAVAKKLGLSNDKIAITLPEHGNTSAASIPLALDYAIENNQIKRGNTVLVEAFGGGIVWGGAVFEY